MKNTKMTDEMNWEEFKRWADEYIIDQFLDRGIRGIRDGIYVVMTALLCNKVIGGKSKK